MARIEVRTVNGRCVASIAGMSRYTEWGETSHEAVGRLVLYFPTLLGLSIEDMRPEPLDGTHPQPCELMATGTRNCPKGVMDVP